MVASNLIPALQLSIRAAAAAALALVIAQFLRFQHPLYAMISAVIVTDLLPAQTLKLAVPRLAGTLLGSVLGGAISTLLPPNVWVVGLGILLAMFLSHLFYLQAAARVAGYVCGIVLVNYGDAPWSYALFRMLETALGIGTAMCVSLVPLLLRWRETNESAARESSRS